MEECKDHIPPNYYIWKNPWDFLLTDLFDNYTSLPFLISDNEIKSASNFTTQRLFLNAIHFLKERQVRTDEIPQDEGSRKPSTVLREYWNSLLPHILNYQKGPYGNFDNYFEVSSVYHLVMNGIYYSHMQTNWRFRSQDETTLQDYLEHESEMAWKIESAIPDKSPKPTAYSYLQMEDKSDNISNEHQSPVDTFEHGQVWVEEIPLTKSNETQVTVFEKEESSCTTNVGEYDDYFQDLLDDEAKANTTSQTEIDDENVGQGQIGEDSLDMFMDLELGLQTKSKRHSPFTVRPNPPMQVSGNIISSSLKTKRHKKDPYNDKKNVDSSGDKVEEEIDSDDFFSPSPPRKRKKPQHQSAPDKADENEDNVQQDLERKEITMYQFFTWLHNEILEKDEFGSLINKVLEQDKTKRIMRDRLEELRGNKYLIKNLTLKEIYSKIIIVLQQCMKAELHNIETNYYGALNLLQSLMDA